MKITVCIRQSADGEINPFDASAYEMALRIKNSEITLLSMGPERTTAFLSNLTRLGAARAVHLCDKSFAKADTLATAYTLSMALKKLSPDLIICGRQSVDGDTGQVGPSISEMLSLPLITGVMKTDMAQELIVTTRSGEQKTVYLPALITVEKSLKLRLPSIRSNRTEAEVWNAQAFGADILRCGLAGSPTRVIKTFANNEDWRNCQFIEPSELNSVIEAGLSRSMRKATSVIVSEKKLKNVWCVGKAVVNMAKTVGENITVHKMENPEIMAEKICAAGPDAVLWGSDALSKEIAPRVAAQLQTGLCADCTALETDGETLYMYRPACSGDIIAKIYCITSPAMATIRTLEEKPERIIIGVGYGARAYISEINKLVKKLGGAIAATRKIVDNDYLPYENQVGLTGKTVNPDVYIALGISGAMHHIVGIRRSGTVIAINTDKNAPIFKFADYGLIGNVEDFLSELLPV